MAKVLMLATGDETVNRYNRVYFNRLSASAVADKFITKRWYVTTRTVAGAYVHIMAYSYAPYIPSFDACQYLFSFVGSARSHRVRAKILTLKHPRAHLEDTSATASQEERKRTFFAPDYNDDHRQHYGRVSSGSKFVPAPRGYGPSSWRLLEAMRAGRVPVIISDQWVAPKLPDWNSLAFALPRKM